MIEWILDIAPREGMQFALGGVQSLKLEVDRLQLPLLVRIWAQSSRDGLYYDSGELTGPARHVVAAVVLANRAAQLDDVAASRFFQVLEQSAAQNEVALRREMEPKTPSSVLQTSSALSNTTIVPLRSALFRAAKPKKLLARRRRRGRFSRRLCCGERPLGASSRGRRHRPVMTLAFGPNQTKSLTLALSLPLANLARGDLEALLCHRKQSLRRPERHLDRLRSASD